MNPESKRTYLVCLKCDRERLFDGRLRKEIARREGKEADEIGLEDLLPYLHYFKCDECGSKRIKIRTADSRKKIVFFVASQNKDVFHKNDCIWFKHVNMENLMRFDTREAPIALGLKPCKVCRP